MVIIVYTLQVMLVNVHRFRIKTLNIIIWQTVKPIIVATFGIVMLGLVQIVTFVVKLIPVISAELRPKADTE